MNGKDKNPAKYLVMRINEYQLKNKTQTKKPDLNSLLNVIIIYILNTEKKHDR